MTALVDVANSALSLVGTRSSIASLSEQSPEARTCNLHIVPLRDRLIRMAPWNCATTFASLALICAAPGTPENPTQTATVWQRGMPQPPWLYEYAYPSDCVRPLWIVPQFSTGFADSVPITTAITGGAPQFLNGPPVKFKVALDQITNGTPTDGGTDTKVILTNQEDAILSYLKQVNNLDVLDAQFVEAWERALAAHIAIPLTGDKGLANLLIGQANGSIQTARTGDANEGLTINDITPDFIRVRGVAYPSADWGPNYGFDWGSLLPLFS